jgi:hypothetical protein
MWTVHGCCVNGRCPRDRSPPPETEISVGRVPKTGLFSWIWVRITGNAQSPASSNSLSVTSSEVTWNPVMGEIFDQIITELDELPETQKVFSTWDKNSPEFAYVALASFEPILSFGRSVLHE